VNHFSQFNNCPVCNECLDGEKEGTFQELLIGVAPNALFDTLTQNAYADPDHSSVGRQMLWALNCCRDILSTHLVQLNLEIARHQLQAQNTEARRLQVRVLARA
jgi:hypothetical protein